MSEVIKMRDLLPSEPEARVIIQEKRADLERAIADGDEQRRHDINGDLTVALMQLELIQGQAGGR